MNGTGVVYYRFRLINQHLSEGGKTGRQESRKGCWSPPDLCGRATGSTGPVAADAERDMVPPKETTCVYWAVLEMSTAGAHAVGLPT